MKMNSYNCPNCGAVITTDVCQYCGTVFLDFAAIQANKPSYIKFKVDDPNDSSISNIYLMKLTVDELEFKININSCFSDSFKSLLIMIDSTSIFSKLD